MYVDGYNLLVSKINNGYDNSYAYKSASHSKNKFEKKEKKVFIDSCLEVTLNSAAPRIETLKEISESS